MTDSQVVAFKPKKSVALSGVTAGNTALCTVGKTGNDLHYRGYDILDIATQCEFERSAHLLVHEKLPNRSNSRVQDEAQIAARAAPRRPHGWLGTAAATSHPMDVLRTGYRLGCLIPEAGDHPSPAARDIADRLLASQGSMLCYWHHYATAKRRIDVQTAMTRSARISCTCLHGREPPRHGCAPCTRR